MTESFRKLFFIDSSKYSASIVSFLHLYSFCPAGEEQKRLFCSLGLVLHQRSRARERLEAHVIKMFRHVEGHSKSRRMGHGLSGETFVRYDQYESCP